MVLNAEDEEAWLREHEPKIRQAVGRLLGENLFDGKIGPVALPGVTDALVLAALSHHIRAVSDRQEPHQKAALDGAVRIIEAANVLKSEIQRSGPGAKEILGINGFDLPDWLTNLCDKPREEGLRREARATKPRGGRPKADYTDGVLLDLCITALQDFPVLTARNGAVKKIAREIDRIVRGESHHSRPSQKFRKRCVPNPPNFP